jgi:hypothetical protein
MVILYIYRTFVENVLVNKLISISISIDDQHFSKFFLFFPLIFETSSVCGPFLICTSVSHRHIYEGKGGGNEREHIHISGDSSPICKRHLESIINYFFPNRLVETSGDCEWTDNIEYTSSTNFLYIYIQNVPSI